MVIPLLQLAVVGWLPGAVILRARWLDREARARLDAEERWFWAVVLSLAVSLSAALALAWIGRYTLGRLLAIDLAVAAIAAAASRFDLRFASARRPGLTALVPLALVVLGLWRFFPPSEHIVGGKDPGVYMNEGIQIAQRGTFLYEDPVVASVPPFARDLFFPSHEQPDYYGIRFMGFRIVDPDSGLVVGQFPHLYPAAIAIGYGIDGLTGARRTIGVFAILGVLAVYFAGARLFGRAVGAAAAVLLALNLAQVWYARYPNTELVMQALLFAALLATARSHVDGDRFFAPAAGYLLGLLLFLRIDGLLAMVSAAAGIGLLVMTGGRVHPTFVGTAALTSAVAAVYLLGPMRTYAGQAILFLTNLAAWQYAAIGAAAAALLGSLVAARRVPAARSVVERIVPGAIAAALVAAAVYALWFREPAGRLAAHDAYALRTFTEYYFTLPALLAALAGYALAARGLFWRAPALFAVVAAFSFFFFYKIRIFPDHFWMARRFLHVIIPGALLFASAAALSSRSGRGWPRAVRLALGVVFLLLVGREYARVSTPVAAHVDFAGVIPRIEQLAASIGDRDLVLVESRDAGNDVHTLALPLAYIYARDVLVLHSPVPDKATFAGFLLWAAGRYERVLFLGAGGTELLSSEWSAAALATERFSVPEYDAPGYAFPRHPGVKQFDYTIYELTLEAPGTAPREFDLDIGVSDDLNVLRFHAKEDTEGRTFRWSQDVSYVVLPGVHASSRVVTVWMNDGGRPPAAPPADVTIALDDERLGTVSVRTGFEPYSVTIPDALAARLAERSAPVRLKLSTPIWRPVDILGTPDDRELGVMVDRVTIK